MFVFLLFSPYALTLIPNAFFTSYSLTSKWCLPKRDIILLRGLCSALTAVCWETIRSCWIPNKLSCNLLMGRWRPMTRSTESSLLCGLALVPEGPCASVLSSVRWGDANRTDRAPARILCIGSLKHADSCFTYGVGLILCCSRMSQIMWGTGWEVALHSRVTK